MQVPLIPTANSLCIDLFLVMHNKASVVLLHTLWCSVVPFALNLARCLSYGCIAISSRMCSPRKKNDEICKASTAFIIISVSRVPMYLIRCERINCGVASCRLSHCVFRWVFVSVCHCAVSGCDGLHMNTIVVSTVLTLQSTTFFSLSLEISKTFFKPYYQIRFSFFRLKFANIYYFIVLFLCVFSIAFSRGNRMHWNIH